jgi:hypothetical protein
MHEVGKRETELTAKEAARELGLRLDSLYHLIWSGRLKARQELGRWLVPVAEVKRRRSLREAGKQDRRPVGAR